MPMEAVFGYGLGASSAADFPLPVFRAFRCAAHDFNWARLFKPNVGQPRILSNSAGTHLRMPRFVPHVPHTQNTSTSSLAPTEVHFTERVSVCTNIVQPPASCNSKRWCNKRAKIVRHNTLVATMQASTTTFRRTGAQIFWQRELFAFYARTFDRARVLKFVKYYHPVVY